MLQLKKLPFKVISRWAVASVLSISLGHSAMAQCVCPLKDGGFEEEDKAHMNKSKWIREGSAGIDFGTHKSFHGLNNASVNADKGWNAIRQPVRLDQQYTYVLEVYIKTSDNVRDGYFGFRDATQHPVAEIKFGASAVYRRLTVRFKPPRTGRYYVFAGAWSPGQPAWIKVDEFSMTCPCPDVNAVPAEN